MDEVTTSFVDGLQLWEEKLWLVKVMVGQSYGWSKLWLVKVMVGQSYGWSKLWLVKVIHFHLYNIIVLIYIFFIFLFNMIY